MAYTISSCASSPSLGTFSFSRMAQVTAGKVASLIAAHKHRRTLAILESLPMEIRKDIGWQTGN